jgi:single-stranded DNA-binding protein
MFHVNRVTLLGNVASDNVSFDEREGKPRSVFTLETKKTNKDAQIVETESHVIVSYGELARFAKKSLDLGAPVYLEGHLSTLKTGETIIVADRLVLLAKTKPKP